MVRLTEEMVVARTRISDLKAVKKLNCWGTELTDVSILRDLKKVEVLSLSVNNIDTLADFQYCPNLQDLFVRKNNIKDLNEVCYLQNLPNLRNLWLDENPCTDQEGYRLAVLRTLPNLEKLDDKIVTTDEIQNALSRGRILIHPLDMDASPTRCDTPSPEEVAEYIDESELEHGRTRYGSSIEQHQQAGYPTRGGGGHGTIQDYQENDRKNANWNQSPTFQRHYQQNNHYVYELTNNAQNPSDKTSMDRMNLESRGVLHLDNHPQPISATTTTITTATNPLVGIAKDYDDQITTGESERSGRRRRHSSSLNGGEQDNFEDNRRRVFPDNGENNDITGSSNSGQRSSNIDRHVGEMTQNNTITSGISPRTSYPPDYSDEPRRSSERRETRPTADYLLESDQLPKRNIDRDESAAASSQGWVRHSDKDKCRFHYHRRPVTRNSNILSAVLCLVKELDYPSLEVVEMAVRNRMDELEE